MNCVWFTLSDKQGLILGYEVSRVHIEGLGVGAGSRDPGQCFWEDVQSLSHGTQNIRHVKKNKLKY